MFRIPGKDPDYIRCSVTTFPVTAPIVERHMKKTPSIDVPPTYFFCEFRRLATSNDAPPSSSIFARR